MSNAVTIQQPSALTAMAEAELMQVLRNSLYPGAKDESIKLVIGYCKAAGLDPMQKPVHIVPMSVATGRKDEKGWDIKEMRDVIMPGIGLYRTQAARGGEYAGVTEPEYGEDITMKLGEVEITFPKWCRITVKRLMSNGAIVEFTAKELWMENYATKSNKTNEPNAMWKRRPYAQLAKCAEAQALRKAFPEFGAQPTADEMEGKELDITPPPPAPPAGRPELPALSDLDFAKAKSKYFSKIKSGEKSPNDLIMFLSAKYVLTDEQKRDIAAWAVPEVIDQSTGEIDPFVADMENAENGNA